MQKHNALVLERAFAGQINQTSRAFGRVAGVEQDALKFGKHADRLDAAVGRNAIAFADVIGVGDHVFTLDDAGAAKFVDGFAGQIIDHLLLLGLWRAGADAQYRDLGVHRAHARDQPRLRAGRPRGMDQTVDLHAGGVHLIEQLKCTIDVSQCPGRIGAAARNDIDIVAFRPLFLRRTFHLGGHVVASDEFFCRRPVEVIQQHVAVGVVVGVVIAGAVLKEDMAGKSQLCGISGSAIVALDPELNPELLGEALHRLQGRGQMGEVNARKTGQVHCGILVIWKGLGAGWLGPPVEPDALRVIFRIRGHSSWKSS